jgi:hypothetical protein
MDDFASALGLKSTATNPFDIALEKEGVLGTPQESFYRSLYNQESSSGKNAKTSNAGAVGGMQILPNTFASVADKGWNINDIEHNLRAGIRYAGKLLGMSNNDERLAAAGYYGGPGGLEKAKQGIAVSDPRNPNAPNTLQYADEVTNRANTMRETVGFEDALLGKNGAESIPTTPKKAVAEEQSKLNSFMAGFGGAIAKTAGAVEQIAGKGIGLVSPETGQKIEAHAQEQLKKIQETTNPYIQANPATATAGEVAGLIANPINKVIPGGAPAGLAGTLGLGAVQGAMSNVLTTPVTDENKPFLTEKLMQAFSGGTAGAAGAGLLKAAGGIAEPIKNALGTVGEKAVKTLRDAGVPIDVAQATGSAFLSRTKAALMDNPFTAGKEEAFAGVQQAAYNKAIARTMGEDATAITPDVITSAKNRLGDIYDGLFEKHGSKISGQVYKDLAAIRDDALATLPATEAPVIKNLVNDIIDKASVNRSTLTGAQYQSFKRVLDRMSAQNSNTSAFAQDMKDVLLSGLKNSIKNPEDIALLKATNKQYGNMKKIEDVVLKNVEGNVSPSLLSNSLATKSKRNAIYAEDAQLADLARAGKLVLEQKLPNSGTVARFLAQSPITAGVKAVYGKGAQMAMHNPTIAKYLEQGVSPGALRTMLNIPKMAGAYVPEYAAKPGVAGAVGLKELINYRNREQQ